MSFNDAAGHLERVHVNADRVENRADGSSDIEHVALGTARVDGNAARVAGASTGACE
jgi:hypothetical protein